MLNSFNVHFFVTEKVKKVFMEHSSDTGANALALTLLLYRRTWNAYMLYQFVLFDFLAFLYCDVANFSHRSGKFPIFCSRAF